MPEGAEMEQRLAAMEAKVAVMEAIMPRIEHKMDCHIAETKQSMQMTNDKLDAVMSAVAARENQAKGAIWLWETVRSFAVFLAGIGVFKWFGLLR